MTVRAAPISADLILDAAEDCFALAGVRRTTIDDIAAAAGVSRITVYRRTGSRDDIVLAVLVRITRRYLRSLRPRLLAQPSLADALALLIRSTARAARRDDLSLLFASEERGTTGAPIPGSMPPLADAVGECIELLTQTWPDQAPAELDPLDAGEWVLRIIVSLATTEPARPRRERETDDWIRRVALPGLLAAPAPATTAV